nr:efflux RND transporter permease subunit [Lysinibacter cavernae]
MRITIPAVLIVAWFAVGAVGGPYFGKVSEVSSNDQTTYLPDSAEATQVQKSLDGFRDGSSIPAVILVTSDSALTATQTDAISDAVAAAEQVNGVLGGSPATVSDDGKAAQAVVLINTDATISAVVSSLSDTVSKDLPKGLSVYFAGPAVFTSDLTKAFSGIDGLLVGVALLAVFVILIIVYRSPLLPLIVLGTSVFALSGTILVVWWLAKAGVFLLNGQVQGILFILVIGAATDYSLLVVSRFREALRDFPTTWDAALAAIRGSIEPIAASGGTVIAGLLCLLLSDLNSNRALGPVATVGILVSMLASMTFLPALLMWAGRAAFWPRRPAFGSQHPALSGPTATGLWPRVGRFVSAKPRLIWVASTLVLLAACAAVPQLKASGVPQSDLVLGESMARDGQVALAEHFPAGAGSPALILVPEGSLDAAVSYLKTADGVNSVVAAARDSPSGTLPVGVPQAALPPVFHGIEPTVSDGNVLLQATLSDTADSDAAETTIRDLRSGLHSDVSEDILVGGPTATAVDSNDASIHDRNLIIPVVLVVILLILMALLRAVVAPILLLASVVLSFGTALGVSALVFNHVFRFPGADPAVPLYAFIFLVALSIDYNIFLMTRVREESIAHGTRNGILRGLSATGGVITSAGVVLAATFAALGVIPILFLAQIAFIVAFGVLLDTVVVRSLLIPALTYDIGPKIWWPSKLAHESRERQPAASVPASTNHG